MQKKIVKQSIFYFLLLIFWQSLVMLKIWPEYILPSPLKVFGAIVEGFKNRTFLIAITVSFKRLLTGFVISIFFGGMIGTLLVKFKTLEQTVGSLVLGLQTLPSICWFPLALIWFGLSEWAIIFVIIAGSLFSIIMFTHSAFKNVPHIYIRAGKNMGLKDVSLLWKILIPAAIPSLLIGFRQSWSFAWRSLMAGELLFNCLGLGFLLNMGRELNDMAQVVAVMFIIAMISIIIDMLIFNKIEQRMRLMYGL